MTKKDLEIVRAEYSKDEFTLNKQTRCFAWTVLIILLCAQISNQWQRFMIGSAYDYEYKGSGDINKYEISKAIPNFTQTKFGFLSGAVFTIFFSVTVLFSGVLSDNMSRRLLLSIASICWSLTCITTAFSQTFTGVAISRMALGFFEAFVGPAAYSLIADYFPPEVRTTAIGVYAFGIYIGVALSSLIVIMISLMGWRMAYAVTGVIGIGIGIVCLLFIKDPERGRYEPRVQKKEAPEPEGDDALRESFVGGSPSKQPPPPAPKKESIFNKYLGGFVAMFTNKVCLFTVLGGMFRFWQGSTISYYTLQFFREFGNQNVFSVVYALTVVFGGFGSQIIAGRISDKLEPRSYKTKPFVCMIMSIVGALCSALVFSFTFSFSFSMVFLFLMFLLGEGWMPPALAMIQTTIDVRFKAVSMAVFLFATAIMGTIGTFVVGELIDSLDNET